MKPISLVKLLCLAAVWGSSFIFMRVLAPVFGPWLTANLRVLLAGIFFMFYFAVTKFNPEWKKHGKHYLVVGMLNAAIPFALYSFAALSIPASYEAILNTTTPIFGAVFAWLWLGERMTLQKGLGFLIAALGVSLVVSVGTANITTPFVFAVLACLLATFCYGLVGVYIKKFATTVKPVGMAGCSQFLAGVLMLPISATQSLPGTIDIKIVLCLLGLAFLCSAFAFLLFYQLVAEIGPTKTMTVAFLIPVFGMLWGFLFLQEEIRAHMVLGMLLIVAGTWFLAKKTKVPASNTPKTGL